VPIGGGSARLKEALREELQSVTGSLHTIKQENVPLDELFYSRLRRFSTNEIWYNVLSQVWPWTYLNEAGITIPSPSTDHALAVYTKKSFKYGWGGVITRLPRYTMTGTLWPFGFETGPGPEAGLVAFSMGSGTFDAYCDGGSVSLLNYLPADYRTAIHRYFIKINKPNAEFYIDYELVAVGLRVGADFPTINGPPYEVFSSTRRGFDYAPAFLEATRPEEAEYPLEASGFKVTDGDPLPPRRYPLYETGTNNLFAGKTIDAGTLTSHPVPVFGYRDKTFYFRAGVEGDVTIEVLTQAGNWRTHYADTVPADTFWWLKMTADAVLARLVYTPTSYPATVSEGEVILSG